MMHTNWSIMEHIICQNVAKILVQGEYKYSIESCIYSKFTEENTCNLYFKYSITPDSYFKTAMWTFFSLRGLCNVYCLKDVPEKWPQSFLPDCAYCLGFAEVERYGCPTELTVFVVGMPGLVGSCVMLAVPFVIDDVTPHTVVTTDKDGCCWPWPCVVCGHITVDASLKNNASAKSRSH